MDGYRRRPLYSADNEDTRSELTALGITGHDTVVAVAAGGGRVLSLLTAGPKRLVAIDRRADQIFTLELKVAAMHEFDLDGFQRFLGIGHTSDRLERYDSIRQSLSRSARRYWDNRRSLIQAGVFFAGRTETALVRFMHGLKVAGFMEWAEPFFQAQSLEEQQTLLQAKRSRVERGLLWWRLFCHPLVIYPLAQDPSFLRSTDRSVGTYLVRRLIGYASRSMVRDSYVLRLAYDCELSTESPLPLYLRPGYFDQVKKNLDYLEIQCGDLRDLTTRYRFVGPVKWSLSDVSCWMREEEFHSLLRRVSAVGGPGSRFCFRNFAASRSIPKDLSTVVFNDVELANQLGRTDSSVIYTFGVAAYGSG